jgi:release factor glutamine methyltransferase
VKSLSEIVKLSGQFLEERGHRRGKRVAEEIIAHVLGLKRMDLYLQFDKPLVEQELILIREMIKRCAKNEPPEYVMGAVEFFGCQIKVNPNVLIPRPETEILVEKLAKRAKKGVLWDLCTGSGCIGIALKKANPELEVTLSDISKEALEQAKENARLNGVEVTFLQSDLLNAFQNKKADWIVCNPPYVSAAEYLELEPSVRNFEPKLALVGGERGVEVYERLSKTLPSYLNHGGEFFFEIGSSQKEALQQIFPGSRIENDWAGHPRFLFGKKN